MHYPFQAGLIQQPAEYRQAALVPESGLSELDTEWAVRFYPPVPDEVRELRPFESQRLDLAAAEQVSFSITPPSTRWYQFQTFGDADTVMVLFEDVATDEEGSGARFVVGDDDSGLDRNARFGAKLFKNRTYHLRIRLYWAWSSGSTAAMMW